MSERIVHHITGVQVGPGGDTRVFLEDGSELVFLVAVDARSDVDGSEVTIRARIHQVHP